MIINIAIYRIEFLEMIIRCFLIICREEGNMAGKVFTVTQNSKKKVTHARSIFLYLVLFSIIISPVPGFLILKG